MKKILISLLTILLFLSIANATILPQPIGGRVITSTAQDVKDLTVILVNSRTGEEKTILTNENGEWLVDWANTQFKYQIGDKISITIEECKDFDVCNEEVTIQGDPIFVIMDITEASVICPPCPTTSTSTTTIATTTISCPPCICPECPECVCPECPEGYTLDECYEIVECPEPMTLEELITYLIIVFCVGFGTHAGYKFVMRQTKEGKIELEITQHKHKGKYEYYHSIHREHQDRKYRHPVNKGEVYELAEKLGKRVINYKTWIYNPEYNMDGEKFPR